MDFNETCHRYWLRSRSSKIHLLRLVFRSFSTHVSTGACVQMCECGGRHLDDVASSLTCSFLLLTTRCWTRFVIKRLWVYLKTYTVSSQVYCIVLFCYCNSVCLSSVCPSQSRTTHNGQQPLAVKQFELSKALNLFISHSFSLSGRIFHSENKLEKVAIDDVLPLKAARHDASANLKWFFGPGTPAT